MSKSNLWIRLIFLTLLWLNPASAEENKKDKKMEHILKHSIPGNPRNSEGAFIKLADGAIYFAYTRYNGESGHDHASADIAAVISKDNGKTWSEPFTVLENQKMNMMSVSLLRLQNGRIAMVYLEKSAIPGWKDFVDCRPKIIFSDDETASWSAPVEIANVPPAYFVVNNDRMIQLKNGRLIIPAAHHQYNDKSLGAGIIKFFISDDNGETWRIAKEYIYPPYRLAARGLMEPGVIELADGRIMCFIRTGAGSQYKAFSSDNGETWSVPQVANEFLSPESPMSMKRNPANGKLYAIWNDCNPLRRVQINNPRWTRTPLVMAESSDEGATWENHLPLENSPVHGYCYIAMYFDQDKLYLGYCCGGEPDCTGTLQETKLRVIDL